MQLKIVIKVHENYRIADKLNQIIMNIDAYTEKEEKLTTEDIAKLKKNNLKKYWGLIFLLIFLGIMMLIAYSVSDSKDKDIYYGFIFLVSLLISYFIYAMANETIKRKKGIIQGLKNVLTGILTDKKVIESTSKNTSGGSGEGGSMRGGYSSSTTTSATYTYYIYVGDRKFQVNEEQFEMKNINKIVKVHYMPLTKEVIFLE